MIDGGLRVIFRERLPRYHWTSIETGGTGRGIPDSEYCVDGVSAWIEFKKADAQAVTLRPEQVAWIGRRARSGGRVYVAVRLRHEGGPRKGAPVDELWLLDGRSVMTIKQFGLDRKMSYVLGVWSGGPERWDWTAVGSVLER